MKKNDLIFVVEDDQYYSFALVTYLNSIGYVNIECFETGKECLANSYKMPKLVLLDYNLGGVKGIDIMLELISFNSNTPIVFVSAQDSVQLAIDTLKYGAYGYIQKDENAFIKLESIISKIKASQNIVKQRKVDSNNRIFTFGAMVVSVITIIAISIY